MRGGWVFGCLVLLWCFPAWGDNGLRVVTTLPDLADWAEEIGGERVEVKSLLRGSEDVHTYEPKVSDVKMLARARVLVKVGLGLEEWLEGLIENARNSELIVIEASRGLELIEERSGSGESAHRRDHPDSSGRHEHARGNPHVWLDPTNAAKMCALIADGFEVADPVGATFYQRRAEEYAARLQGLTSRLRAKVEGLPDRRVISYHPAWPYFARAFGFEIAGVITPIPGQEPSARGIAGLIKKIRSENIRVVVTEPQLPSEIPELLAQETGVKVVTLSPLLGSGTATHYYDQVQDNVRRLISALQGLPK